MPVNFFSSSLTTAKKICEVKIEILLFFILMYTLVVVHPTSPKQKLNWKPFIYLEFGVLCPTWKLVNTVLCPTWQLMNTVMCPSWQLMITVLCPTWQLVNAD